MAMPVAEMRRTRKSSYEMANTHFSWLKARLLVARLANSARSWEDAVSIYYLKRKKNIIYYIYRTHIPYFQR
jgi:hypothetical protein